MPEITETTEPCEECGPQQGMARPGTVSGAVEHRYGGKGRILINPDHAELLRQEAIIRAEFGEEGVRRFWEEVNKRAETREDGDDG